MNTQRVILIAKALADPTRVRILGAVRARGELNCSQLCTLFSTTQPTVSHHVKTLAEAGLIAVRKEGPFHVLSLRTNTLRDFAGTVYPRSGRSRGKPRTNGRASPAGGKRRVRA